MKLSHGAIGLGLIAGATFLVVAQRRQDAELERTKGRIAALAGSVEQAERDATAARGDGRVVERRITMVPVAAGTAAPIRPWRRSSSTGL